MGKIFKLIVIAIIVLVALTAYSMNKMKQGQRDGTAWAQDHNTKECFEEGLRQIKVSDSRINRAYVSGFTTSCIDSAKTHPGLCRMLPKMGTDIAESNQRRCDAMGLSTGPCVEMLKVYGRYCR